MKRKIYREEREVLRIRDKFSLREGKLFKKIRGIK